MRKTIFASLTKNFKQSQKFKQLCFLSYFSYLPPKPNLKYVNYLDHLPTTLPPTILKPIVEDQQIFDFDDKFGLGNINDPKIILNHLKATNFAYSFNDLKYFLIRLQQITEEKHQILTLNPKTDQNFRKFISEIKTRLKNDDHEMYPYIGTYAYCMMRLDVQDKELWELLEHKIREDQFYTNFKEATYACEGFVMLKLFNDQKRIDDVYKRLERIVNLTIWEVNMLYYKRLAEAFVAVNRFGSAMFQKLEQHIMSNLAMDYEIETMVDILLAFYKSGNGSQDFYHAMQLTMVKGHLFNKIMLLENRMELPFNGRVISNITEVYAEVSQKFRNFPLEPDFLVMMYKMITNKRMNFELNDIVKIMKFIEVFKYEDEKILIETIIAKIPEITCTISFEEIQDFFNIVMERKMVELIPQKVKVFLEDYFVLQIPKMGHEKNYNFYSFILNNNLYLNLERINYTMIQFLNENVYKIEPKILQAFLAKIQAVDEKMLERISIKKINDVLYLNQLENKILIEGKK